MRKLMFVVNERRNGALVQILVTDRRDVALRCKNQCKLCIRFVSERWETA